MGAVRRPGREVQIAVPTRGAVQWATITRLQEVRDSERGMPPVVYQPGHLSVAATRNLVVERFLRGDCKVLVMVDDDVVPGPDFLQIADSVPPFGMVGVPTLIYRPEVGVSPAVYEQNGRGLVPMRPPGPGVHECALVGTGCVAISREALETVGGRPFEIGYQDGLVVSDDVMFCRLLQTHGFKVGCWFDQYADHHARVSLLSMVKG